MKIADFLEKILGDYLSLASQNEIVEAVGDVHVIGNCNKCRFMEPQIKPSAGEHSKEYQVCVNEKSYCYGITVRDGCICFEKDRRISQYDDADKALPDDIEADRRRVRYTYREK